MFRASHKLLRHFLEFVKLLDRLAPGKKEIHAQAVTDYVSLVIGKKRSTFRQGIVCVLKGNREVRTLELTGLRIRNLT